MALTTSSIFTTVFGNRRVDVIKITGDGSTKTYTAPFGTVDFAIYNAATDKGCSGVSWSGTTVTFKNVIDNSGIGYLLVIGT